MTRSPGTAKSAGATGYGAETNRTLDVKPLQRALMPLSIKKGRSAAERHGSRTKNAHIEDGCHERPFPRAPQAFHTSRFRSHIGVPIARPCLWRNNHPQIHAPMC